ncbi:MULTISPECIES: TIGR02301 family protein [Stappiaceae]|uniref:TIGR02301 family protein n=2 Tax=Roseibium aggregatum TaxID=187304 RepID=A0A0M6Y5X2_9HYPH|nr:MULTISPECIES: TIGR02301 family protein [Stappiaceae]NKX62908.1 TIGR02301 family protein [Labrenzia sp. 5N]CTQ45078.1 hypothetical protein LAL4801_03525 [Roseibium aggregatum]
MLAVQRRVQHDPLMIKRRMQVFLSRTAVVLALGAMSPVQVVSAQETAVDAPPYEQQLMRLSEIFGALHFLRPLCKESDNPSWRDRMEDFLDAETLDENRRRRFIERFNQGYRGFSVAYRECTEAARLAMGQYLSEGEVIISDVTSRYGR